jgi:hypothetical protein
LPKRRRPEIVHALVQPSSEGHCFGGLVLKLGSLFLLGLPFIFMFARPAEAESLLCKTQLSTGFRLDQGRWKQQQFDHSMSDGYVIRELKPSEVKQYRPATWGVFMLLQFGNKAEPDWLCQQTNFTLQCTGNIGGMTVNMQTKRFNYTYVASWMNGNPEQNDNVQFDVGTCSIIP